jgi:hypothetical protein
MLLMPKVMKLRPLGEIVMQKVKKHRLKVIMIMRKVKRL